MSCLFCVLLSQRWLPWSIFPQWPKLNQPKRIIISNSCLRLYFHTEREVSEALILVSYAWPSFLFFIDYSFLGRHASALLALLNDGGDRDPEILEQVGLLIVIHKSCLQLSSRSHMFCCISGLHILVVYNDVLAKVSSERYCPNS